MSLFKKGRDMFSARLAKSVVASCFIFCVICFSGLGCRSVKKKDSIFQVSTIPALLRGDYDGPWSCGHLKTKGNLGLGTFNGLDGELICVDGKVYQGRMDGSAVEVIDEILVPFAAVTFFEANERFELKSELSYEQLKVELLKHLPSKNIPYAFKIDGFFDFVKYRSVPRQRQPYPPLTKVVKKQSISKRTGEYGTLVGFWMPAYFSGVNVAGFHLHYISRDRSSGGHLLELKATDLTVLVDQCYGVELVLPEQGSFLAGELAVPDAAKVHSVEKLKSKKH